MVLAIDPSSGSYNKAGQQSYPGYALFDRGELVESGVIDLDGKNVDIQFRLREIYDCCAEQFEAPDVLVIERIRGRKAHEYLKWSISVFITAIRAPILIEMPVTTWRSYAGPNHDKSDENDAIAIGQAAVAIAKGE